MHLKSMIRREYKAKYEGNSKLHQGLLCSCVNMRASLLSTFLLKKMEKIIKMLKMHLVIFCVFTSVLQMN